MRQNVQKRSADAVAAAGTKTKGSPVNTAGTWREQRGKLPQDETFRPGKTAARRKGHS